MFWKLEYEMGIPEGEAETVDRSLGVKVVVNEFVAYLDLARSDGAGLPD